MSNFQLGVSTVGFPVQALVPGWNRNAAGRAKGMRIHDGCR